MAEHPVSLQRAMSRPPCPFYGFYLWKAAKLFRDQRGNQCPLREGYAPCFFESTGKPATWTACPINRESPGLLETLSDHTVLVEEFPNQQISLKRWAEYVL